MYVKSLYSKKIFSQNDLWTNRVEFRQTCQNVFAQGPKLRQSNSGKTFAFNFLSKASPTERCLAPVEGKFHYLPNYIPVESQIVFAGFLENPKFKFFPRMILQYCSSEVVKSSSENTAEKHFSNPEKILLQIQKINKENN